MRCKSCNSEMSEVDHARKDLDGSFVDLCSLCWSDSERNRYESTTDTEDAPQGPTEAPRAIFDRFVARHGLRASWRDGLGLKWTPQEREDHLYRVCYGSFVDLYQSGYGTVKSLERACGIHRGDRRHEFSEDSFTENNS